MHLTMRLRGALLLVVCSVALLATASVNTASAEVVVGLFSDQGSNCSFSGDSPGVVTAHVVVRPNGQGIHMVRFAAQIPPCFSATFIEDLVPDGIYFVGESQTGISLAWSSCETNPIHVLDIKYYSNGATTPCCAFSLTPDPTVGALEAIDCSFASIPLTSITSHLNADTTCACHADITPPNPPTSPRPVDGAIGVSVGAALGWECTDPNDLPLTCDVYLGTDPNPPLVASDLVPIMYWTYTPARLSPGTVYHWRVVGRNSLGGETSGPTWTFTTGQNQPPFIQILSPANGALITSATPTLTWIASDDSPLLFDVYFGTNPSPPKVASNFWAKAYSLGPLAFNVTYYWYVVARDLDGAETQSQTWSFTTTDQNQPPSVPALRGPAPSGVTIPANWATLEWSSNDPEGHLLTFDVYLGTVAPLPKIATNRPMSSMLVSGLAYGATYQWRVVARDDQGLEAAGPVWTFVTKVNLPPNAPSSPTPADGAVGLPLTTSLSWQASDPNAQALTYDVYFGTTPSPPLVASNVTFTPYYPGTQTLLTRYWWRIVARDPLGLETSGPTWSYTTKAGDDPPTVPVALSPLNFATSVPMNALLSWQASDPEGQALNYDVYFGTATSPPLVANHITTATYNPGLLAASTNYFWRIVARDPAGHATSGPVWTFWTGSSTNLPPSIPSNPFPSDGGISSGRYPLVTWSCTDPNGDPLNFMVYFGPMGAMAFVGSTNLRQFQVGPLTVGEYYQWFVVASDSHVSTNGPLWSFRSGGGGELPVAFTAFDAAQSGDGVEIRWKLSSDEAMDGYTLYRREGTADAPRIVAQGAVQRLEDSYLDMSVNRGTTYHYELVVRAHAGGEFRSPIATVTLSVIELALYQNQPNPFNPQTTIRYDLPAGAASTRVRLSIVDIAGRVVRTLVNEDQGGGSRSVLWNGRDDAGGAVSSGVYFYVLDVGDRRLTRKLVLLK